MRSHIYTACRDLSWIAPEQARRLAEVVSHACNVAWAVDMSVSRVRSPVLKACSFLAHVHTSLLTHVREL